MYSRSGAKGLHAYTKDCFTPYAVCLSQLAYLTGSLELIWASGGMHLCGAFDSKRTDVLLSNASTQEVHISLAVFHTADDLFSHMVRYHCPNIVCRGKAFGDIMEYTGWVCTLPCFICNSVICEL